MSPPLGENFKNWGKEHTKNRTDLKDSTEGKMFVLHSADLGSVRELTVML